MAGPVPRGFSGINHFFGAELTKEMFTVFRENISNPLFWSPFLKLDAIPVTYRIRKYVLNGNAEEALRLKNSYKDTFAMEAVAAAIIAQIAITMPGLADFDTIHWTATAFALHEPQETRRWLTSPCVNPLNRFFSQITGHPTRKGSTADDRIPSLTAAAALTAPSRLLRISAATLFIALGIYLGSVYTEKLGTLKGSNANLGVLLFFILFTTWALLEILLPLYKKQIEQISPTPGRGDEESVAQKQNVREGGVVNIETAGVRNLSGSDGVFRQALQASIRAQKESLSAQKSLLQLLELGSTPENPGKTERE